MNPTAIMGGVVVVMGVALYFLFGAYTNQVELRMVAEVAAATNKAALDFQIEVDRIEQEHANKLNKEREANVKAQNAAIAEINLYRQKAERLAQFDPVGFGDDYHVRLARIMCRIEAGTDSAGVQACNNAPPETYLTDVAFTLTVTADNAEIWQEQCGDGNQNFCDWSLTGFTPQAALTLLSWLEQVDGYAREQGQHIDTLHSLIKAISGDRGENDDNKIAHRQ